MPSVISFTYASGRVLIGEADLVADRLAERRPELLGDARRRRRGRRCAAVAYGRSGRAAPRPACSAIFGSCVVLPEPVAPLTMTTGCARIAPAISAARCDDRQLGRIAYRRTRRARAPAPSRPPRRRRRQAASRPPGFAPVARARSMRRAQAARIDEQRVGEAGEKRRGRARTSAGSARTGTARERRSTRPRRGQPRAPAPA